MAAACALLGAGGGGSGLLGSRCRAPSVMFRLPASSDSSPIGRRPLSPARDLDVRGSEHPAGPSADFWLTPAPAAGPSALLLSAPRLTVVSARRAENLSAKRRSAELGPFAALTILKSAIDALTAMTGGQVLANDLQPGGNSTPRIARFEVGPVDKGETLDLFVTMLACVTEATHSVALEESFLLSARRSVPIRRAT